MEHVCQHNNEVTCEREECGCCGWNPEVAKARQQSVRRKLLANQKLYKIPFTGYCEVWATSHDDAEEKASNEDMFFVHYEFGDPICLEKEEEDELD